MDFVLFQFTLYKFANCLLEDFTTNLGSRCRNMKFGLINYYAGHKMHICAVIPLLGNICCRIFLITRIKFLVSIKNNRNLQKFIRSKT